MSDLAPVAILLVTSGTRGERLLFRYPFEEADSHPAAPAPKPNINPYGYAVKIPEDRHSSNSSIKTTLPQLIRNGVLVGFEDKTLATFLAVKTSLCDHKFMVKIDDVRFVGYPVRIKHEEDAENQALSESQNESHLSQQSAVQQHLPQIEHKKQQSLLSSGKIQPSHRINIVNVVFALHTNIVDSAIDCYHDFAKELVIAICYVEKMFGYLSSESKIMRTILDSVPTETKPTRNPYRLILQRSQLAQELKKVYTSLLKTGVVQLYIMKRVGLNFILPHKVHVIVTGSQVIHLEPKDVEQMLSSLRLYHAVLLLQEEEEVVESLPIDASPTLLKIAKLLSPMRSLFTLAWDADVSMSQVIQVVSHLVYFAKARLIYPLCETNEYILSSTANTLANSKLVEEFVLRFPGQSLHVVLSDFSVPLKLGDMKFAHENSEFQKLRIEMVIWMLQHRLIIQIHKYVYFLPKQVSSASSSLTDTTSMHVEEESMFRYLMETPSNLERVPSMSDLDEASVNSDESTGLPNMATTPGSSSSTLGKLMSKSPSLEVPSDGSITGGDEGKGQWERSHLELFSRISLSGSEKAAILQCPGAKNYDDLKLFLRLLPYFNGQHHLEEIMYFEDVRRAALLTLIDKFKDVLFLIAHDKE